MQAHGEGSDDHTRITRHAHVGREDRQQKERLGSEEQDLTGREGPTHATGVFRPRRQPLSTPKGQLCRLCLAPHAPTLADYSTPGQCPTPHSSDCSSLDSAELSLFSPSLALLTESGDPSS